ncbi:hypothetical protein T492DRAFT_896084, partial [Pavlovales sp. CCMP2436]
MPTGAHASAAVAAAVAAACAPACAPVGIVAAPVVFTVRAVRVRRGVLGPAPFSSYEPYQPARELYQPGALCLSYVPYESASKLLLLPPLLRLTMALAPEPTSPRSSLFASTIASCCTTTESLLLSMLSLTTARSVHGHFLDAQNYLPINLAVSSAPTEASVLTPLLSLKINSQKKFISPDKLKWLSELSPLLIKELTAAHTPQPFEL